MFSLDKLFVYLHLPRTFFKRLKVSKSENSIFYFSFRQKMEMWNRLPVNPKLQRYNFRPIKNDTFVSMKGDLVCKLNLHSNLSIFGQKIISWPCLSTRCHNKFKTVRKEYLKISGQGKKNRESLFTL